jgi:hypothetical protein
MPIDIESQHWRRRQVGILGRTRDDFGSTSLIALGFTTGDPRVFAPMASVVLPTLFLLGWFTVVRLTEIRRMWD